VDQRLGKYLGNKLGIKMRNNKIQEMLRDENMAKKRGE